MSTSTTVKPRSIIRTALTASAGASIEWYDFFIYGTVAALVLPTLFFPPSNDPLMQTMQSMLTFGIGFVARPIGGIVFGHFGDKFGRKRALSTALIIMGLGSTAIGLLPTYQQVGILAPILLTVLRFVQGLAIGGQWGGAALLAIETAPANRRGFYGSFVQMGVPIGLILADTIFLIVSTRLNHDALFSWGWRVPFLFSLVLIGIGLYIQFKLEETVAFENLATSTEETGLPVKQKSPILSAIAKHPIDIILAGGAFVANNTCFYIAITYALTYAKIVKIAPNSLILGIIISSIIMMPVLILSGLFTDFKGRRPLFMVGALLAGLWAFPFFHLFNTGSAVNASIAVGVEMALLSLMYGPQAALFAELFPVEVRYSGASIGYQFGAIFGGAFAPIIAIALWGKFHSTTPIATYLLIMCLISFVSVGILSVRAKTRPAHM